MDTRAQTRIGSAAALFLAVAILGGCDDLVVPDLNNPSIGELQENPSRAAVNAAATGLLIGAQDNIAEFNGYVSLLGILGRESYNLDGADPRFITQMLVGPLDGGTPSMGGNLWAIRYQNIRNAHVVLNALDELPDQAPEGMTPAEKEATRGFAKTIQALDFLLVINTRDENGAPIDVDRPIDAEPAPIESKDAVFQHIVTLLDEARTHLQAGGDAFPFPLSDGFQGFDAPQTFLEFNRALRARVAAYREDWDGVLAALQDSFLDEGASLDLGVYHSYGTASGQESNGLVDPDLYAHTSIRDDAQLQPGGQRDARYLRKVESAEARTLLGVSSDLRFTGLYPSPSEPVPIIRNEELVLLRAEAYVGLNMIPDAADDINLIRQTSGGLAARADLDAGNIVDELLYNRRYSLLFEGGHRWIDARRYDRLDDLPLDQPEHTVPSAFPIPADELLARGGQGG